MPASVDHKTQQNTEVAEQATVAEDDRVQDVINRAEEAYDLGLEALQGGDEDEARSSFALALETIRSSGFSMDEHENLRIAWEALSEKIAAIEIDLEETPDHPPADEQVSPADEMGEIPEAPGVTEGNPPSEPPADAETTWDIPMVVNDRVLTWVGIFRGRNEFNKSFVGGYQRYGWYEGMIKKIFKEEGLPEDLIYLAFMESTYKTSAYSRARARGIWQFMTPTGREYGLKVNRYVDERAHPEKSTRAAARYLRDLYATFGHWHLAMAAYNTGAGNVMRAQRRTGKSDYWDLAASRHMRTETKNFVPGILALALMSKNPERYGFTGLVRNPPLTFDRVAVDGPTRIATIARLSGATEEEIKFLNPHLRIGVTPPGEKSYEVLVPSGRGEGFLARYREAPVSEKVAAVSSTHRVRSGETLAAIAAKYGTTVHEIALANNLRNIHRLSVGMELEVPGAASETPEVVRAPRTRRTHGNASRYAPYHVVRRGDTLFSIARSYGVPLKSLLTWNGLSEKTIIKPGFRLIVGKAGTAAVESTPVPVAQSSGATPTTAGRVSVPGGGEASPDPGGAKVLYKVRRGDSLQRIAVRFRTTVANLRAWNNLVGDALRAGEVLTIYSN